MQCVQSIFYIKFKIKQFFILLLTFNDQKFYFKMKLRFISFIHAMIQTEKQQKHKHTTNIQQK